MSVIKSKVDNLGFEFLTGTSIPPLGVVVESSFVNTSFQVLEINISSSTPVVGVSQGSNFTGLAYFVFNFA